MVFNLDPLFRPNNPIPPNIDGLKVNSHPRKKSSHGSVDYARKLTPPGTGEISELREAAYAGKLRRAKQGDGVYRRSDRMTRMESGVVAYRRNPW
jgi:hypothetical protein